MVLPLTSNSYWKRFCSRMDSSKYCNSRIYAQHRRFTEPKALWECIVDGPGIAEKGTWIINIDNYMYRKIWLGRIGSTWVMVRVPLELFPGNTKIPKFGLNTMNEKLIILKTSQFLRKHILTLFSQGHFKTPSLRSTEWRYICSFRVIGMVCWSGIKLQFFRFVGIFHFGFIMERKNN